MPQATYKDPGPSCYSLSAVEEGEGVGKDGTKAASENGDQVERREPGIRVNMMKGQDRMIICTHRF